MKPESVFSVVNVVAFLAWLTLIVRPRHPRTLQWIGQVVPWFFALIYFVIIALRIGRSAGNFSSLAGVAALFQDPWILLAGWVHYLAFDLLIGVWEVRDAATRNLPHWRVVPCLLLTFMFGPVGWLLYQGVRSMSSQNQSPEAMSASS